MPITKVSLEEARRALEKVDWAAQDALTDEDIARQIAGNPDAAPDISDLLLTEGRIVRPPSEIDVRTIREKLHLSQTQFAARFGFSLASIQNWEQGHRKPDGAARMYLLVIEREPEAVLRALHQEHRGSPGEISDLRGTRDP